jgi:hypothetical protein
MVIYQLMKGTVLSLRLYMEFLMYPSTQQFYNKQINNRINGFSNFAHRPDSKELEDKNTMFRKLDLFPSSGERRHLFCWVP